MQTGKEATIMLPKNSKDNPIQETESDRLKAHFPELEKPFLVSENSSKLEESTEKSQCQEESRCNAITSNTVADRSEGTVEEMSSYSGRERLKRHRVEVAGQVWIPDIWGQENFLKDWIDCAAFDASLVNNRIMLARAALMDEGSRPNSAGLSVENENSLQILNSCKMQTTNSSVEEPFQVRKLEISDKNKGFVDLLQQLTVCGSISDEAFEERFHELAKYGNDHVICVIEDNNSGKIIATGSLFIEKKFVRNCGKAGHIEDVVVDSSVRGKQLGKKIVGFLSDHAKRMDCYKVILDCSVENRPFYERCGFKQKEVQMVKYFV